MDFALIFLPSQMMKYFFGESRGKQIKSPEINGRESRRTNVFLKTECMNTDSKTRTGRCGDINNFQKFNYVGEILTLNINEKSAIKNRARNMEVAFRCQKT